MPMSEVIRFPDNVLQRIEDHKNNAEKMRLKEILGYLIGACDCIQADPPIYRLTLRNNLPTAYKEYLLQHLFKELKTKDLITLAITILGETAGKRANSRQEPKPMINLANHQQR